MYYDNSIFEVSPDELKAVSYSMILLSTILESSFNFQLNVDDNKVIKKKFLPKHTFPVSTSTPQYS